MEAHGARSSIAKVATARDTPDKPYEVRARVPVGLLLRVQPSGLRTFYVQLGRGKRVKIGRAGNITLKQAETQAKRILLQPEQHARRDGLNLTLAQYLDGDYTAHATARLKNGMRSVNRVRATWKPLLKRRMADITANDVDRLRTARLNAGKTPATINRDVSALSGVFALWAKNHPGVKHPLAGLEALDVADDEQIRYLRPDEALRLRQALAGRPALLQAAVLLSLNLGLRRGELFAMDWANVDMERKTVTVLASHSKGNSTRTVPLNDEALSVLTAMRAKSATGLVFVSPRTKGKFVHMEVAWGALTKAAALPDFRWHDMRHDFASQLVMRGVPLYTVQKLLGHANARMTQRYAKLAPGTLADAVKLLGVK
jgi:integrase